MRKTIIFFTILFSITLALSRQKKEFDIEYLESKRNQYLGLQKVVKNFVIIDANRSLESVVHDVRDRIIQFRDLMAAT